MLALALLALGAACATEAKITIDKTTPTHGSSIEPDTVVRVVVDYSVNSLQPGRDKLSIVFKARGGGTWEPARYVLPKAQGQFTFEVPASVLLNHPSLVHPIQVLVALDRWDSADSRRAIAGSQVIFFRDAKAEKQSEERAAQLSASIGKGQLLSDLVNDPRYRPRLPPGLNKAGMAVWGMFKLCVDNEGDVYRVTIIRHAHDEVDDDWTALLRTLKHKPYTIDGQPVPYCYPLRLEVRSVD